IHMKTADGVPIGGAEAVVLVRHESGPVRNRRDDPLVRATSDAAGTATFRSLDFLLPSDPTRISIAAAHAPPGVAPVVLPSPVRCDGDVDLVTQAVGRVRVEVRSDGASARGASVSLILGGSPEWTMTRECGSDGVADFPAVPVGVALEARAWS